jgi:hypothetical protein
MRGSIDGALHLTYASCTSTVPVIFVPSLNVVTSLIPDGGTVTASHVPRPALIWRPVNLIGSQIALQRWRSDFPLRRRARR